MKKKLLFIVIIVLTIVITIVYLYKRQSRYVDSSQIISVAKSASFTQEYVENKKTAFIVEVPPSYELLNIVIALGNIEEEYSSLTRKNTEYYYDVIDYFIGFKDHEIVEMVKETNGSKGYSFLRNIFIYELDGNEFNDSTEYKSEYIEKELISFIELLQDFAIKSNFDYFYQKHIPYYIEQINSLKRYTDIKRMLRWLEYNFTSTHSFCRIVLSPLTGGSHNTVNYSDKEKEYSEIVVFVSTPDIIDKKRYSSLDVYKGLIERTIFTEIDHNYVNPTTNLEKYNNKVVNAFSNIPFWNKASGYKKEVLVFNEYMTWGTFLLYASETYESKDFEVIKKTTEDIMDYRGFSRFKEFGDEMLRLKKENTDKCTQELYEPMIKWAKSFN